MLRQIRQNAPLRPIASLALAAAVSLLFAAPALAGGSDKGKGAGPSAPPPPPPSSFVKLAHDDDHFFDHETDRNRHCTDGHGHDDEHNPHCKPVSP